MYIIDRIEGNIAVLENSSTKQMLEVNINNLPNNIKEGSVLIQENDKFKLNINEEEIRRKRIEEKFNKIKK